MLEIDKAGLLRFIATAIDITVHLFFLKAMTEKPQWKNRPIQEMFNKSLKLKGVVLGSATEAEFRKRVSQ